MGFWLFLSAAVALGVAIELTPDDDPIERFLVRVLLKDRWPTSIAMPARLKVFRATLGFYEAVVAAASQAGALRAWGVRENLFQHGAATTTDDPLAVEPALAQPGVVLRRAVGGTGPFAAEPDLPATPIPRPAGKTRNAATSPAPPPKPLSDRAPLTAAERALSEAEAAQVAAQKAIAAERVALDARQARLEREHDAQRRALEQAVKAARRAFARAGGTD